jgi:hypothetical protein
MRRRILTDEERRLRRNAYHRAYRQKHLEGRRNYNREWMRRHRAKKVA